MGTVDIILSIIAVFINTFTIGLVLWWAGYSLRIRLQERKKSKEWGKDIKYEFVFTAEEEPLREFTETTVQSIEITEECIMS